MLNDEEVFNLAQAKDLDRITIGLLYYMRVIYTSPTPDNVTCSLSKMNQ